MPLLSRVLLPLATVSFLGLIGSPVHAQSREAPLHIEVALEGKPALTGELQVTAAITNIGQRDLELPASLGWDREGGLVIEVTQVSGPALTVPLEADDAMRSTVRAEGRSALTLMAGHGIALSRTVTVQNVMPSPGTYRVVVAYRGLHGLRIASEPVEFVVGR